MEAAFMMICFWEVARTLELEIVPTVALRVVDTEQSTLVELAATKSGASGSS